MTIIDPETRQENYPNFVQFVWFERLKFCGCYSPAEIAADMKAALEQIALYHGDGPEWFELDVPLLMLYVLDAADLTDHGGTVGGCWISDDGRKFLACFETKSAGELIDEDL